MIALGVLDSLPPSVRERSELGPLRYAAHKAAGIAPPPALRGVYLATLARNLLLLDRAAALLDHAAARGVTLLPLKGALLADVVYGDPGARPMADLDLAVRPADLTAACDACVALGYQRMYAGGARHSPRHAHDVAFTDGSVVIELHHHLFHELAVDADVEPLFARAIAVEALGRVRPVPAWEDQLWLLAVHAATHAFGDSALWLFDLALVSQRADGNAAAREAERRRAGVAYRAALRLAQALLPSLSTLPAPAPTRDERLRERLLDRVLGHGTARLAAPPRQLPSLLARAILTERPRDALAEIARKLQLRAAEWCEPTRPS